VLAVNQRSTNGRELWNREGLVAWVADVPESTDKYVAFFNAGAEPSRRGRRGRGRRGGANATAAEQPAAPETKEVRATFAELGLPATCTVRDLCGGGRSSRARASLTARLRPWNGWASNLRTTSSASVRSANSTNAKPRGRPVSRSTGMTMWDGSATGAK
jgi:hypothetical protein